MIKAIAFDGNGVLYHRGADFVDALMDHVARVHAPGLDKAAGVKAFRKWMLASFDGSMGKEEALAGFLDEVGIEDPAAREDIARRELEYSRAISLFPTERETLLELDARGFPMGMITNTFQSAREKAGWFEAMGLGCAVREVVSSIDLGVAKPDPRIYHEFARRLGLSPAEVAFIGHEEFEIEGARRAGMVALSFNCGPEISADFHLNVFADLLDFVDRCGKAQLP